jgi:hypothetical protein
MKKQQVSGVKNYKKARRSNNEENNRNNPGFAHRGNVYLYLKRKGTDMWVFCFEKANTLELLEEAPC